MNTKFCMHCGETIDADCVVCPKCGKQVEKLAGGDTPIIINNSSSSSSSASVSAPVFNVNNSGRRKSKWVSLLLCIFTVCGHKFYEGKIGMGILYFFTLGLFGIGWLIDIIVLLGKPDPYYV